VDETVRILHDGPGYRLGAFRCRPGHPRWREENWIGLDWHIVLPGPAVWIQPACQDLLLATANEALYYPPDTHYRRRLAAPCGDRCLFVAFDDELARELGIRVAPARLRRAALGVHTYAAAHQLARALDGPDGPDGRASGSADLGADERLLGLLHKLAGSRPLRPPGSAQTSGPGLGTATRVRYRSVIEQVKYELARRIGEPVRLAEIAAAVNYSPYHLARLFRAHTGLSMHGYLKQLRLRESLDAAVEGRPSLAELASAYGFASHSHYTRTFRQVFGVPPTALRSRRHTRPGQLEAALETT
jgi:AraC-like DNA-binding protein